MPGGSGKYAQKLAELNGIVTPAMVLRLSCYQSAPRGLRAEVEALVGPRVEPLRGLLAELLPHEPRTTRGRVYRRGTLSRFANAETVWEAVEETLTDDVQLARAVLEGPHDGTFPTFLVTFAVTDSFGWLGRRDAVCRVEVPFDDQRPGRRVGPGDSEDAADEVLVGAEPEEDDGDDGEVLADEGDLRVSLATSLTVAMTRRLPIPLVARKKQPTPEQLPRLVEVYLEGLEATGRDQSRFKGETGLLRLRRGYARQVEMEFRLWPAEERQVRLAFEAALEDISGAWGFPQGP